MVIEERYGEAPEYSYVAGKPKFSQAVNGVQTVHEYEATTLHDAIHKHSVISKANGELVIAQSRKTEEFIAADDTITFEQESIWDGENWPFFLKKIKKLRPFWGSFNLLSCFFLFFPAFT